MTRMFAKVIFIAFVFLTSSAAAAPKDFQIVVQRQSTQDGLLKGKISVNGEEIGTCYENAEKRIPAGSYKGKLRYKSAKNFVQGPGGKLGKSGDFLLEVAGVPKRTDILIHAGSKPEHSEGCIMLGPATKDSTTSEPIASEALKKLRLLFYEGNDSPKSTPDKAITVEVHDP